MYNSNTSMFDIEKDSGYKKVFETDITSSSSDNLTSVTIDELVLDCNKSYKILMSAYFHGSGIISYYCKYSIDLFKKSNFYGLMSNSMLIDEGSSTPYHRSCSSYADFRLSDNKIRKITITPFTIKFNSTGSYDSWVFSLIRDSSATVGKVELTSSTSTGYITYPATSSALHYRHLVIQIFEEG